ncbi:MAG TPA: TRAP transporter small permease [Clostridia bacterium]|nr:TRAP transporter small permease [Clostridia bacterium]
MRIKKLFDKIEKSIMIILSIMLFVMVGAIFTQVIMRYVFNNANAWSEELAKYTFVWLTMLGSAVAVRKCAHMKVDYFINMMPKKLVKVLNVITNALLILFFLVVIKYGFDLVGITFKQKSAGMGMPMAYPYLALPIGGILMLMFTIESYFNKNENNVVEEG